MCVSSAVSSGANITVSSRRFKNSGLKFGRTTSITSSSRFSMAE